MPKQVDDNQVFRAVTKLLVEKGYAGTTTKQIAEEANINEVTLFRKYGSKAQLVIQSIAERATRDDIHSVVQYSGDIEADLLTILTRYMAFAEEHGEFFPIILSEMSRYPELAGALDTPMRLMQTIGALLERYQQEGTLAQEPPMSAVVSLIGPLIVNTMVRRGKPDAPLPKPDLEGHVRRYLNGRKR